jgi:hypothetical protein
MLANEVIMENNKTANKEENITIEQPQQKISPNVSLAAADSTMVASSKFDIKIFFGVTMPTQPTAETQYHTILTLSPQLAQALAKSLQSAVDDYDKKYMPLKMRDGK